MVLGPILPLMLTALLGAGPGRAFVQDPDVVLLNRPQSNAKVLKVLGVGAAVKTTGKPQDGFVPVRLGGTKGFIRQDALGPGRPRLDATLKALEATPDKDGASRVRLRWRAAALAPGRVDLWDALVAEETQAGDPKAMARALEGRAQAALQDGSWDTLRGVVAHGHLWWPRSCVAGQPVVEDGGAALLEPGLFHVLTSEGMLPAAPLPAPACVMLEDGGLTAQPALAVGSDAPGVVLRAQVRAPGAATLAPLEDAPRCGGSWSECRSYVASDGLMTLQLAGRSWDGEEAEDTHAPGFAESAWRAAWKTTDGKLRWSSWQPFARAPGDTLPLPVAVLEDAPGVRRVAFWLAEGPCCPSLSHAWLARVALAPRTLRVHNGHVVQGGLGTNPAR